MSTPHRKGVVSRPKWNSIIPSSLRWNPLASSYACNIVRRLWDIQRLLIHLGGILISWGLHVLAQAHCKSVDALVNFFFFTSFRVHSNIMEACFKLWGLLDSLDNRSSLYLLDEMWNLTLHYHLGVNETCLTIINTILCEYL